MPDEYVDLILCRDIFHCTPSELDEQDYDRVMLMLGLASAEAEIEKRKSNKQTASTRGRGGKRGRR